jgi:hypothetical protein
LEGQKVRSGYHVVVVSMAVPAAKVVKIRKFVIAVGGVHEAARLLVLRPPSQRRRA